MFGSARNHVVCFAMAIFSCKNEFRRIRPPVRRVVSSDLWGMGDGDGGLLKVGYLNSGKISFGTTDSPSQASGTIGFFGFLVRLELMKM